VEVGFKFEINLWLRKSINNHNIIKNLTQLWRGLSTALCTARSDFLHRIEFRITSSHLR
jgi:hypothetical protein